MSRTYAGESFSRGKDALRRYCYDESTFMAFIINSTDESYLKRNRQRLRNAGIRMPEKFSVYQQYIRDILDIYIIEHKSRTIIPSGSTISRAVSHGELQAYISNENFMIEGLRSYCHTEKMAIRYAANTGKTAVVNFILLGDRRGIDVNSTIQASFSNEEEIITSGGRVTGIKYIGKDKSGIDIYEAYLSAVERNFNGLTSDDIIDISSVLAEYKKTHDFSEIIQSKSDYTKLMLDKAGNSTLTYPELINAYIYGEINDELFEDSGFIEWSQKMKKFWSMVFILAEARTERDNERKQPTREI